MVWHLSLPLMNGFNKTGAAIFPMQAILLWDIPFFSDEFVHFVKICCIFFNKIITLFSTALF